MQRGQASFLTTRPAEEAWKRVKELYKEEGFVQGKVAVRLGVHSRTLWRWLKRHKKYEEQLTSLRAKYFESKVD